MNKILKLFLGVVMCITLTSCVATTYAQRTDDIYYDNTDIHLVITKGIPYYTAEGLLMYYLYENMYYYPYFYNNRYYFHRYERVLPNRIAKRYPPIPRNAFKPKPRMNQVTRPNKTIRHIPNRQPTHRNTRQIPQNRGRR